MEISNDVLTPIQRLNKDLKNASKTLSAQEVRFLVDMYYTVQKDRIQASNQVTALTASGEPTELLEFYAQQFQTLENQIKLSLDYFSKTHAVGVWMRQQKGIGPVIASGLLAHIDIEKAPTAGHIWSFAGLDPTKTWNKGEKRPWNGKLKVLCWKIGESFVKVSGNEDAFYGQLYKQRKEAETTKNDAGAFKEQAEAMLKAKNFRDDTNAKACYTKGILPPGHIHARAKRYAVKMFLSHVHHVWYLHHFKKEPPKPFAIAHLAHVHEVLPPGLQS